MLRKFSRTLDTLSRSNWSPMKPISRRLSMPNNRKRMKSKITSQFQIDFNSQKFLKPSSQRIRIEFRILNKNIPKNSLI